MPARLACILALSCMLNVLEPASAFANGPTIGYDGGSIVPLANPDIELVVESVDLYAPLTDGYEKGQASYSVSVIIEYEIEWSGGSDSMTDGRQLRYYARPARLWAGVLRSATFRLHLGEMVTNLLRDRAINRDDSSVRLRIEPPDARWTRDGLEWVRANWEPDTDFRFGIDWDVPEEPGE